MKQNWHGLKVMKESKVTPEIATLSFPEATNHEEQRETWRSRQTNTVNDRDDVPPAKIVKISVMKPVTSTIKLRSGRFNGQSRTLLTCRARFVR